MLYSILIYGAEDAVHGWTRQQEDAVWSRHAALRERLGARGKLGPVMRLMPTTTATTLRISRAPLTIDGPFAETKEQLLGIYVVDCASLQEALEAAHTLGFDSSVLEIRPIATFQAGKIATGVMTQHAQTTREF